MDIVSNVALISINETLIFQIISFLIFLFIINRVMFRPLRNVMTERDEHIRKTETDTVDAQKKFDSITSQISEKLSQARKEALELKEKLESDGNQESDDILASAKKEIAAANETAQKDVEAQVLAARKDLQEESEALALNIMERILDRRLQP
jgi:F-type H+-transporting ATPase subunit b